MLNRRRINRRQRCGEQIDQQMVQQGASSQKFSSLVCSLGYGSLGSSLSLKLLAVLLGVSVGINLTFPGSAQAAERLVVTYGPLSAGVSITELETLVNTGEASGSLKFYLGLANLDPSLIRNVLAMELGASSDFMSGMLESESGQHLLSQISEVVHLPPDRPEIQILKSAEPAASSSAEHTEALRTALIEAAHDRHVTVLEVLQHYPTERVYVDAAKLLQFANSLQATAAE